MTPSTHHMGKQDLESPAMDSRQPSETKAKKPPKEMNAGASSSKPTSIKASPAQLFEMISKNYDNWSQVMAKQFEDEDNFSPFPKEDDPNPTESNPIFNYNLLEALESVSNQAGERIQEITNDDRQSLDAPTIETPHSDTSKRLIKHPKKKIICPPQSLLNDNEIDFIRDKIAQIIKQREGGDLPANFNLFESSYENSHLDDNDLSKLRNEFENAGHLNPASIEIEFSPIPECKIHGLEDCDCPIFDEVYGSSSLSSNGLLRESRPADSDNDSEGPSCEFTFEYDSSGRLLPTGNNIEEKLRSMNQAAEKLKGLKDELNLGTNVASRYQENNPPARNQQDSSRAPSSGSSTSPKHKSKLKRKSKREISDPLDDLKRLLKEKPQDKLDSSRLRNRVSTTPRNYYGLIPSDKCCLLCQYEAVFGMKPRYLVGKKAS
ncbi:hypothetical protein CANMA_001003 [Candida margitis]|uniref:uncharacterized protein n=1 Tax=Candida margitis TaxID=1775924 RepID=UPI00222773CC|nr:uncharacterized protein CANMA_001003 [Candida margitis]KAI5969963.1 hypothetical protein CANMA_001003 [Candida margitis]